MFPDLQVQSRSLDHDREERKLKSKVASEARSQSLESSLQKSDVVAPAPDTDTQSDTQTGKTR